MTQAETSLWFRLRRQQLGNRRFRRQVPVGHYIVDFACLECMLIVEVDGSQHLDSGSDASRDAWLRGRGFRVLRFWNHDVLERIDSVLGQILEALAAFRPLPPSGHLPPQAGEGVKSAPAAALDP